MYKIVKVILGLSLKCPKRIPRVLTEVHKKLPALTISYSDDTGFTLVDQKGKEVDPKTLTNSQQALLKDYEMIQYDMTAGSAYALKIKGFYTMKK